MRFAPPGANATPQLSPPVQQHGLGRMRMGGTGFCIDAFVSRNLFEILVDRLRSLAIMAGFA